MGGDVATARASALRLEANGRRAQTHRPTPRRTRVDSLRHVVSSKATDVDPRDATYHWCVRPFLTAVLVCVVLATISSAEEWPQFRGPTGQGHSTEAGLPTQWSETSNVVWKTPV